MKHLYFSPLRLVFAILLAVIVCVTNPPLVHAAPIDIGTGAIERTGAVPVNVTYIDKGNSANDTGEITSAEFWFLTNGVGVKVGTFYGSGTSWTNRDVESIGNVTAGSKQTFSGLHCAVATGDLLGVYYTGGGLCWVGTGYSGMYSKSGDQMGTGTQTYLSDSGDTVAIYGTGVTVSAPTATSAAATSVEEVTATTNGNITSTGGENCDKRGVVYDTSTHADPGDVAPAATYSWYVNENGSFGTGAFSENITGLTKGEEYFYRMYAHNSVGYDYSNTEQTFLTKPDEPSGFTATANGSGIISLVWTKGSGSDNTTVRAKIGAYADNVTDGTGIYDDTGTSYNHSGLTSGNHWYYRMWSWAAEGGLEQYSDLYAQDEEIVLGMPTVTTSAASNVEEATVTLNGAITNIGIGNASARGFDWDVDSGAPYASSWTEAGSFGVAAFSYSGGTYSKGTLYYARAKAQNADGWGYGSEVTFLTKPDPPTGLSVSVISSSQLTLAWTSGAGAARSMVRYKGVSSPISVTDGTLLYLGAGSGYGHTMLDPGQTVYYSVWSEVTTGGLTQYSDTYASGSGTTSAMSIYLANFKYYIPITVTSQCATAQELRIPFIINSAGLISGGYVQPDFDDMVLVRVDTLMPLTVTDITATTLWKSSEATATDNTTALTDTTLTQADDYWNGCILTITETTDGLAPQGESKTVTDYSFATHTLTFGALSAATTDGDLYTVGNYRSKYFTNLALAPYQQVVLKLYLGYAGAGAVDREFCTDESDTIIVPDHADFDITDNLTVSATVKFFDLPGTVKTLVSKNGAYELGIDASNKPYFRIWHGAATDNATGSTALVEDMEYVLKGTYDNASDNITVYVGGAVAGSKVDAAGAITTTDNVTVLMDLDNCEVDDIMIGRTSLTAPTYSDNFTMEAADITSAVLVDKSISTHNANITWDISLPSCVTVEVGAVAEVATWVAPGSSEAGEIGVFELPTEPTNWMPTKAEAEYGDPAAPMPAYQLMHDAAVALGWNDATMYRIMVFFTAIGVGAAVGIASASALLTGIATGTILAAGAGAGIIGFWVVLLYALFAAAYIVASRSM